MSNRQHQSVPGSQQQYQQPQYQYQDSRNYQQHYNNYMNSSPPGGGNQYDQYNFSENSPPPQSVSHRNFNTSSPQATNPYMQSYRYYFDQNGSPESPQNPAYRPSEFSEKKKAQLQREKAVLDDNMKDLSYMELITGTKQNQGQKQKDYQMQSSPLQNNKTPNRQHIKKSHYMEDSLEKGKYNWSPDDGSARNNENNYYKIDQNTYQEYMGGPPNKGTDQRDQGLTPKAAKHFEGVKNLYRQELDILKYNINQCMQQDRRIAPQYEAKEQRLWEEFSQSPSPNRGFTMNEMSPINENQYQVDNRIEKPLQKSALRSPQQQQRANYEQYNSPGDESDLFTYSKNPDQSLYSQNQQNLRNSGRSQGIPLYEQQQNMLHISERQAQSEESKFEGGGKYPIEEEIQRLRNENDQLRRNLYSNLDPKLQQQQQQLQQQQVKGVSFSSKEKSIYYDKNSPSIATNPYQRNLYNSAQNDNSGMNKGSNIITENDNSHIMMSPNQQTFSNPRDAQFSQIMNNPDQEAMEQYLREEREQNSKLKHEQELQNSSPYRKLSYFDQMKKIRMERQREESELQAAEVKRNQFQRNVLRQKQKQQANMTGTLSNSKRGPPSYQKSKFSNQKLQPTAGSKRHSSKKVVPNYDYDDNQSLRSGKFQTPQKVKEELMQSMNSHRSQLSLMDMQSFTQLMNKEFVVEYQNYMRKVSKYDLDRCAVDIQKLKREKQSQRNDDVKNKKEEAQKAEEQKIQEQAEATKQRIEQLATIKEKQEKERKEFVRKQQEMFRKAIEDHKQQDKNQQYLSPSSIPNKKTQRKQSSSVTPVKAKHQDETNSQNSKQNWAGEIQVVGSQRSQKQTPLKSNGLQNTNSSARYQLPLQNIQVNEVQ